MISHLPRSSPTCHQRSCGTLRQRQPGKHGLLFLPRDRSPQRGEQQPRSPASVWDSHSMTDLRAKPCTLHMGHTHPRFPKPKASAWITIMPPRSLCCNPNPNQFSDPLLRSEQQAARLQQATQGLCQLCLRAGGSSAFLSGLFIHVPTWVFLQARGGERPRIVCVCPKAAHHCKKFWKLQSSTTCLDPVLSITPIRNKTIPQMISIFLLLRKTTCSSSRF